MRIPALSVFDRPYFSFFTCTNSKFSIGIIALLLIARIETTGKSVRDRPRDHSTSTHIDGQPYIDTVKFNTTVYVGQTAYLPCVVKHLGDKTVSWIRRRDLHILTSGSHTYTSDPRVSILREGKLLNSWILKIMTVGKKDEGYYECQVNTEPKMTASHYLTVFGSLNDDSGASNINSRGRDTPLAQLDVRFDPKRRGNEAKIIGPMYVYVKSGEMANFTCVISHLTQPPNVTWFLDDTPIQRSSATRGGISLETQKSHFSTITKLIIARVYSRDEGKYSCGGDDVDIPAHVYLRLTPYSSRSGSDSSSGEEDRVNELSGPMVSIANSNWSQDKELSSAAPFFIHFLFRKSSFLLSALLPLFNPLAFRLL